MSPGFAAVFAYEVDPGRAAEFEAVYGPDGEWARFFRTGAGYAGTELWRDGRRYLVIDRWASADAYAAFLAAHDAEYRARSAATAALYVRETPLGRYEAG
jgi:heme-degrading monooxygenase HmoA